MGPFDNEAGVYIASQEHEDGDWYVDNDGQLYIVPADGEIEGPDNDLLCRLNDIYREDEKPSPAKIAEELGLELVAPVLKRFDAAVGYYHA